jgi:hypothetical protein
VEGTGGDGIMRAALIYLHATSDPPDVRGKVERVTGIEPA